MNGLTVLVYHAVGDVPLRLDPFRLVMPKAKFARHMAYLAAHHQVVPLEPAVFNGEAKNGRRVAVTFDDAYRSVLTEALPILRAYGLPATVFAPTAWLGRMPGWDAFPKESPGLEIMSAEELIRARALGLGIGSHGHAHLDLSSCSYEEAYEDLAQSMRELTRILGEKPALLAYPWGNQSPEVRWAAQASGFEVAFSVSQKDRGPYGRERINVRRQDQAWLFRLKASGTYLRTRYSPTGLALRGLADPLIRFRRERVGA